MLDTFCASRFLESEAARVGLPGYNQQFEPEMVEKLVQALIDRLEKHVHVMHPYVDETMDLRFTLRERLKLLSPEVSSWRMHLWSGIESDLNVNVNAGIRASAASSV